MARERTVNVFWTRKKQFDNAIASEEARNIGVYQIYRKYGSNESLLYIGIVKSKQRQFSQRLIEHYKAWLRHKRGTIYVRFGLVEGNNAPIEEIESVLIFHMQPPCNTNKKNGYSLSNQLIVHNCGPCGHLPKKINSSNH